MPASLPSMAASELACRRRGDQIFSSTDQPPPPPLPLGAGTANLPDNRRKVTSQFPDVVQSWNSEIDRLGHALAELRNHEVGFSAQGLDDRRPRQPASPTGAVEQGE